MTDIEELEAQLREANRRVAAEKARGKIPELIKLEKAIKKTLGDIYETGQSY